MSSAPPAIRLRDAALRYKARAVLAGLDLDLPAAQWTGLLGASGVGKSSLLRLIAGLPPARRDDPAVTCSDGLPPRGRIAYMAQQDLLLPWLSVFDNVVLGSRLRRTGGGPADRDERARDLLTRVGLAERAGDLPASLSGGMRQRVALARTLMEDRPIVLMDEPFQALDAITRQRLQDLAARLLAGRTVLLVTHDPLEALRLCHRIHVMSGQPARLGAALAPASPPPRAADDEELLTLQGRLLVSLAEGRAAA